MDNDQAGREPATILLVEDNRAHAKLVVLSLEEHREAGRIVHVSDGEEALDYLFRRGAYADPKKSVRPRVVLLDLRLPKIHGLKVLEEIRNANGLKDIPVVIFTSSEAKADVDGAYEHHANSYVVKPFDYAELERLVRDLSRYWLVWNHCP